MSPVNGKVLRLHFACRAELPHGSALRVTSSNLWASTVGNDDSEVPKYNQDAMHGNHSADIEDLDSIHHAIYSSSVEMVTTPDEYPLWRTRTPVICVVNNPSEEGTFRHCYRYLVVTPGAHLNYSDGDDIMMTSHGDDDITDVTTWEDPFEDPIHGDDTKVKQKYIENLPYRSIDIDVSAVESSTFGMVLASDSLDTERTKDGLRIDHFDKGGDISFQSYRDFLEEQEENKNSHSELDQEDPEVMPEDKRLYIVCYHLPVNITRDDNTGEYNAEFSESLIAKTEHSGVSKSHETHWIGTVSAKVTNEEEREKIRNVLKPLNCAPLFLEEGIVESFYYGMCKQILWPAFHNIDLLDISKSGWGVNHFFNKEGRDAPQIEVESNWDQSRLDGWWNSFCAVNRSFADALMRVTHQNDIVWVHDYHLAMLPQFLHEAEISIRGKRTIQMVFFLHIPFPTSQVFRELERGEQILEGILHADVVGFHAFDHARHFLNASKRILGLKHESLVGGLIGVRYRGTKVLVTISNVSIESDVVQASLDSLVVREEAEKLKLKHEGRSIISGIDVAQGLSGLSLKLLTFERFLVDYPDWRERAVLMQICLIPSTRKNDEADTLAHVRYLVKRIHNAFGHEVLDYEELSGSSYPRDRRLALWLATDVLFSTPIREGLTLLPLEYAFARKSPMPPGVTITSEFSTVCNVLNGALRVNPYDIQTASTSIVTALSMTVEERSTRRERDIEFVSTSSSGSWTRRVLRDLNDVTLSSMQENSENNHQGSRSMKMDTLESTSNLHVSATPLDMDAVIEAYNMSKKRVIFVDFNGTIVMKEPTGKYHKREMLGTSGNKPPKETMRALIKLCADERNIVYVVSGDTEKNIENAIGGIHGVGLASGNGGSISLPLESSNVKRKWHGSNLGVDWDAVKRIALPIFSKYTARANGSFVKLTSSSIGWSYYSCDPEWGSLLASHLVVEMEQELHAFDIRLVTLKGVIEVVPRRLNKGLVVKEILRNSGMPDFILCMGDDVSDEKMFTSVFSVIAQSSADRVANLGGDSSAPNHAFTVTVGKKPSNASYFLENAEDVANLLIKMSGDQTPRKGCKSWDMDDTTQSMFG